MIALTGVPEGIHDRTGNTAPSAVTKCDQPKAGACTAVPGRLTSGAQLGQISTVATVTILTKNFANRELMDLNIAVQITSPGRDVICGSEGTEQLQPWDML